MFRRLTAAILTTLSLGVSAPALAQPASDSPFRIEWEVKNRFRLFREERDFQLHVDALRGQSILDSEFDLAEQSEGRGWARNTVGRLCVDAAGAIAQSCNRDGVRENYLNPAEYRVGVRLDGAGASICAWHFARGDGSVRDVRSICNEEAIAEITAGPATNATVDITRDDGSIARAAATIEVRDLLIAGLGDSIAAGEGNPDRPVALADDGFCFRQFIGTSTSQYFRPGRAGFKGDRACDQAIEAPGLAADWNRRGARWLNAACHRSLYSYQLRAALALAVEHPHIAVTFLPLACTGATIDAGLIGPQRARELDCGDRKCETTVPAQLDQLATLLRQAQRENPARALDLIFLTVGANDIGFSGLVADVIIDETWSRALFKRGGVIGSVDNSQALLEQKLPGNFAMLRAALKPLVGDLSRVVYTSYANPVLDADGGACRGGRDGFDVHPAFTADPDRMRAAASFVERQFLPSIKALATCTGGGCVNSAMTFVDAHQRAFAGHGLCARADTDPEFDHDCFSPDGTSFTASASEGARTPLACPHRPSEFRAYASRARWIRTANDSYFSAMTYPQGVSSAQPTDIHDATWGVLSAVYGGAVHPTAEGYAAMADAANVAARRVLTLPGPQPGIARAPLPPPEKDAE
ncbi:MAG: hypothetical protein ACXWJ0_01310 [Xanthobacteraceae bacterium]